MFDTNGTQLRSASSFKMTFSCAYTNGSKSYMPSAASPTENMRCSNTTMFRVPVKAALWNWQGS